MKITHPNKIKKYGEIRGKKFKEYRLLKKLKLK